MALLFAYPENSRACWTLARLAREELRHFEQVERLRRALGIPFRRLQPSRYANALRAVLRTAEPGRQIDRLLLAAFIEERSHERFVGLIDVVPAPVGALYRDLAAAEQRHRDTYVELARDVARSVGDRRFEAQLERIARLEAQLATSADRSFRFHSGPPTLHA
ncbi:MAG: hypothetical protein NZM12_08260 [Steroidobacteraceae bacterium]|nr:hypothetical protein [Steroidobacteraceae bacterium]MDW8260005.1 tRNA isopentenyl-2-thiomethyl-A-37 hydroxylase MiaE [Gammaproteobacteria bacterium]